MISEAGVAYLAFAQKGKLGQWGSIKAANLADAVPTNEIHAVAAEVKTLRAKATAERMQRFIDLGAPSLIMDTERKLCAKLDSDFERILIRSLNRRGV